MKLPPKMKTYCPYCRKHTDQKVSIEKVRQRGAGKSKGARSKERRDRGYGNHGRFSKRAISQRNMTSKTSKKVDLRLKCPDCGKKQIRNRPRAKRVEMNR